MYIKQMVYECDYTGRKYKSAVEGAGALAQAWTGEMCIVAHVGPEFLAEYNISLMTVEDAESWAKENGGWLDI
jgi:hypothetical protein